MKNKFPFHLSLPCKHLTDTKQFYLDHLGGKLGRHTTQWADINLYGTQLTFVKSGPFEFPNKSYSFEGIVLSHFHFGVLVDTYTWNDQLKNLSKKKLIAINEFQFFEGHTGEHLSFFVKDPNGYLVEFKCFTSSEETFKD